MLLYNSVKKEEIYPQFIFNHNKDQNYFKLAEDIIKYANQNNLDYFFGGGIAHALYFGKMYRSINDIDFRVKQNEIPIWEIMFKQRNCYYHGKTRDVALNNPCNIKVNNGGQSIPLNEYINRFDENYKKIFMKNFLNPEIYQVEFKINNDIYKVELHNDIEFKKQDYITKDINGIKINLANPEYMIRNKKRYSNREKDAIDIEYYGLNKYNII
jgi:hypothetical protein